VSPPGISRRKLATALFLIIVPLLLLSPLAAFGFRDAADYVIAGSARLLGDLGFARLGIAPALGGPELQRAIGLASPVTLLVHAILFAVLGDSPAPQLLAALLLHLFIMGLTALVAYQWRPNRRTAAVAALLVGLHPLAAGTVSGITPFGGMLAMFCVLSAVAYTMVVLREGRFMPVVAVTLFAVLASIFDASGLLVVPAVLLVSFLAPRNLEKVGWLRRLEPPVAVGIGVGATYIVARAVPDMFLSWQLLLAWQPRQLAEATGWLLRALAWPALGDLSLGSRWLTPLLVAIPLAAVATITVIRARRRPSVLVWPAIILASLLPALLTLQPLRHDAPATAWAAFYPALAFFALWIADLWPRPELRRTRIVLAILVAVVLIPQTAWIVQQRAERARNIQRMGQDLSGLIAAVADGTDIVVLAQANTTDLVEAAFLSAYYHGVETRQVRFRMLVDGWLALRESVAPSGQAVGKFARLPLYDRRQIIGLDAAHEHFVDLTSLVIAQAEIAQDILNQDRRGPPPLALADEATIRTWLDDRAKWRPAEPATAGWFVEGIMLRMHPHTGRMPM